MIPSPPHGIVDDLLRRCLDEDLGTAGDLTSEAIFAPDHRTTGRIVARSEGTIAGLDPATRVFALLDPDVRVDFAVDDGATVGAGTTLATVQGATRAVLTGERTCLNLLGHLSGIATATHRMVDAVGPDGPRIADTRKTTPGLRALEKYAVRCGGGSNHRFGLHDAVMIKDNHVAAAGGVTAALEAVHRRVGHTVSIVVEVDHLDQIEPAIAGGADVILLDNLRGDDLRAAVASIAGRAVTEASGGITADSVSTVADAGVDVISIGWITHSAPRLDVALDL